MPRAFPGMGRGDEEGRGSASSTVGWPCSAVGTGRAVGNLLQLRQG